MRRASGLAVLLAVFVALTFGACGGGGDDGEPASDEASQPTATAEEESDAEAQANLARLREDFELNFGGAGNPEFRVSWYTEPESLEISGSTLEAHTGWFPDAEGEQFALNLCRALYGNYVRANDADYGIDNVVVYGGGDPESILASVSGFSGECET